MAATIAAQKRTRTNAFQRFMFVSLPPKPEIASLPHTVLQNLNSRLSCILRGGNAATACPKNGDLITPIKVTSFWGLKTLNELRTAGRDRAFWGFGNTQ